MSATSSTIYFVSGANRGLGLNLVTCILQAHETAFVYAGARDPEKADALRELEVKYSGRIAIVKCVSADSAGNAALAKLIEERHGRLDTAIANAGIWNATASVADVDVAAMEEHFHVNVTGAVVLFQTMRDLLKKSAAARFITISTVVACIGGIMVTLPVGSVAYGASKAALNWATRKIHFENEWLTTFPLSPRPIATDMLQYSISADTSGWMKKWTDANPDAPSVADVAKTILQIVDASTREKDGGQFRHSEGKEIPW